MRALRAEVRYQNVTLGSCRGRSRIWSRSLCWTCRWHPSLFFLIDFLLHVYQFSYFGGTNYISMLSPLEQMVINNGMPEAANTSFPAVIEAEKPWSRVGKPLLACRRPSLHGKERISTSLLEGTGTSHVRSGSCFYLSPPHRCWFPL